MGKQKRQYTKEFKLEAIRLYESGATSMRQVEEDLGITAGLLNKWRAQQHSEGQQAFVGSGHQGELESEVRRLKRENEVFLQDRKHNRRLPLAPRVGKVETASSSETTIPAPFAAFLLAAGNLSSPRSLKELLRTGG